MRHTVLTPEICMKREERERERETDRVGDVNRKIER
jgi:hypothetical protein